MFHRLQNNPGFPAMSVLGWDWEFFFFFVWWERKYPKSNQHMTSISCAAGTVVEIWVLGVGVEVNLSGLHEWTLFFLLKKSVVQCNSCWAVAFYQQCSPAIELSVLFAPYQTRVQWALRWDLITCSLKKLYGVPIPAKCILIGDILLLR